MNMEYELNDDFNYDLIEKEFLNLKIKRKEKKFKNCKKVHKKKTMKRDSIRRVPLEEELIL